MKIDFYLLLFILMISTSSFCESEIRLKELGEIAGARGNQLFGYGLVVGLNGTGDKTQTVFTGQSLMNMLDKLGIVPSKISKFGLSTSGTEMKVKNVAAVLVTAELGPFIRKGTKIDVTISSIGDCNSLEGGTLVMTPLQGADGKIYAVAQGPISIGGMAASTTTANHPTVGHIPQGAYVENEVPVSFIKDNQLSFILNNPDFTTMNRIVESLNQAYPGSTKAIDSGSIDIKCPKEMEQNPIGFISILEQMMVKEDTSGIIVINERTGTIVTGDHVVISTVAVSHGSLSVSISPDEKTTAKAGEKNPIGSKVMLIKESVTLGEVAKSLNALGATPTDMIAIFQAMRRAGAIQSKLEIM